MEKILKAFGAKLITSLIFLYSCFSYFLNKFIKGESYLPFKTILELPKNSSVLLWIGAALFFTLIGILFIILKKDLNYNFTISGLVFFTLCLSLYTKSVKLPVFLLSTLIVLITVIIKRRTWLKNTGLSLYVLALALISATLSLNSIASSISYNENELNVNLAADDRLKSIVSSTFRDKDFSFKTGVEGTQIEQAIDEHNTKYFGQFNAASCNESGSTTLKVTKRFDYRLVQGVYYTRTANSGNLWLHDASGLSQKFMELGNFGLLTKVGENERWAICETFKNTLPKISDLENTSDSRDNTRFFSVRVDSVKLALMYNRNLWLRLQDQIGLRGLDLLTAYGGYKLNSDYKLEYDVIRYELDADGILTTLFIGSSNSDKGFRPVDKIVFNTASAGSVAKPNAIEKTPANVKEIMQIKNR